MPRSKRTSLSAEENSEVRNGTNRSKLKRKTLDHYKLQACNKAIKVGDSVLMRPPDSNTLPYIGKIKKIESDQENNVWVHVQWYYRPEETESGRRSFYGIKEFFLSNHSDKVRVETILDTCKVHRFEDYVRLKQVGSEDYFYRFEYNATTGELKPDRVEVHCVCEMPCNPDQVMVQCDGKGCRQWFHPRCLNLSIEQARSIEPFFCPTCLKNNNKRQRES